MPAADCAGRSDCVASLHHIRFSYDGGATWALDDVGIDIHDGEFVCLAGPNGSGKSTLARLIAGLAAPDSGDVSLMGHVVFNNACAHSDAYRDARKHIGAVFQNPRDQIVTTVVEDDVAFGPENLGIERDDIGRRIDSALDAVDMGDRRAADPTRMSGGQQQRIAIAGMLAMDSRMLVLDEPTAMLDPHARRDFMGLLSDLHKRGTTIVLVTHHADELNAADRIVRLRNGHIVPNDAASAHGASSDCGVIASGVAAPDIADDTANDDAHRAAHHNVVDAMPVGSTAQASAPQISASQKDGTASDRSPVAPALSFRHVAFRYPDTAYPVFEDVSFDVVAGEIVALMGANGAGKSTIARLACALAAPSAGSITVAGITVARERRKLLPFSRHPHIETLNKHERKRLRREIGFVMQHPERQLFAQTVAQDVAYGPTNQGLSEAEVQERVADALQLLQIEHLAERSPFSLSGGQRRLVAIAGVVACGPRVLVLDEPTASLDAAAASRVRSLITRLAARGVAVLIITHAQEEADLADRVIRLGDASDNGLIPENVVISTADVIAPNGNADIPDDSAVSGNAATDAGIIQASKVSPTRPTQQPDRAIPPLARIDARVKTPVVLALMLAMFAVSSAPQLLLGLAMTLLMTLLSGISAQRLLRSTHMILALLVIVGLLNVLFVHTGDVLAQLGPLTITDDGITTAVLYATRFALVIVLGAVFLYSTTPTAMTDAFEALLSPLRRFGWHTQELALVLSLALRFLPDLASEARAVMDAQAARGGDIESGSPMRRARAMAAVVVPVFAGTLRHVDGLALALDARCYEEGLHRTHWRVARIATPEILLIAGGLAYVALLLALPML